MPPGCRGPRPAADVVGRRASRRRYVQPSRSPASPAAHRREGKRCPDGGRRGRCHRPLPVARDSRGGRGPMWLAALSARAAPAERDRPSRRSITSTRWVDIRSTGTGMRTPLPSWQAGGRVVILRNSMRRSAPHAGHRRTRLQLDSAHGPAQLAATEERGGRGWRGLIPPRRALRAGRP